MIHSMSCRLSRTRSKFSKALFACVIETSHLEKHAGSNFSIPVITRVRFIFFVGFFFLLDLVIDGSFGSTCSLSSPSERNRSHELPL